MNDKSGGFTLVELAIVITIIGLLIGGVLKGQELLQNARMTSYGNQWNAISTAVVTFKDVYKALPGDMPSPSNFLENCTSGMCALAGNGDGQISGKNESNAFWIHLGAAKLLSGVKMDKTWTSSGDYYENVSPDTPFGGMQGVITLNYAPQTDWPEGLNGHIFTNLISPATGILPLNVIAKLDLKLDDGRPRYGELMTSNGISGCNVTTYNPDTALACNFVIKGKF